MLMVAEDVNDLRNDLFMELKSVRDKIVEIEYRLEDLEDSNEEGKVGVINFET